MDNVHSSNDNEEMDKLSSFASQRTNSLPAPCGIKNENLIRPPNRGSTGLIVIPTELTQNSRIDQIHKTKKGAYFKSLKSA